MRLKPEREQESVKTWRPSRGVLRKMRYELCPMLLAGLERCGLGFDIGFTSGDVIGDLVNSSF